MNANRQVAGDPEPLSQRPGIWRAHRDREGFWQRLALPIRADSESWQGQFQGQFEGEERSRNSKPVVYLGFSPR
jgi:hypothetical protein